MGLLICARLAACLALTPALISCAGRTCDPRLPFKLEGRLVHGDGRTAEDDKIYIVVSGEKRWITSWDWIFAHGFTRGDLMTRPSSELACLPDGTSLP